MEMMSKILVAASILVAAAALAPTASAVSPEQCKNLPDRNAQSACYQAAGGGTPTPGPDPTTLACDGGEKGYEACGAGQCPTESKPDPRQKTGGCSAFVCGEPDWNALTPEGGDDCLDMICRNVPPQITFVQVTLAPVLTLLGGTIPGATVLRAVVLNAGFYCERGTGTGGPGNPCQHVLTTPVGRVGADPEAWVNQGYEKGIECSWAQSGALGYNYVYDNGNEAAITNGNCNVNVYLVAVVGGYSENYRFTDSCTP